MKKILITGGNGQLAKALRRVTVKFPDLATFSIDKEDVDLTKRDEVWKFFSNNQFDVIVNCAAYTAVDKAESDQEVCSDVNTKAVENLALSAAANHSKVIQISTDYVFDGKSKTPYRETDKPNPRSVYGLTKLKGEKILAEIIPDSIIIRTEWLYSPFGHNFYLTMKQRALACQNVRVVCDQWGTPTNAFDLSNAIAAILSHETWEPGIYHVTNDGKTTWFDFTREIYKLLGKDEALVSPITTEEYKAPAQRPKFSVLDNSKFTETYNHPMPDWNVSLHNLISEYGI